jgi:hypothetical protein
MQKLWGNPGQGDVVGWRDALARAASLGDLAEALAAYDRARLSGDDQLAKAVLLEGPSRGLLGGFDLDGHDVPVPWVEAISALEDYDSANGSLHRPAQVVGCAGGRQVTGRDDGTRNASSPIDRPLS